MELYKLYNPITATPFACDETYGEYAPCEALKPYIKCFWRSRMPYRQKKTERPTKGIVIPDTCVGCRSAENIAERVERLQADTGK